MAIDRVRAYLAQFGKDTDIQEFSVSSATVDLAAQALGIDGQRIAKSLVFRSSRNGEKAQPIAENPSDQEFGVFIVIAAGDARTDNRKFREQFGIKAKMADPEETLHFTGHAVGGVCPFALEFPIDVYLDKSLQRFETVFPACGSSNSAIELSLSELEKFSNAKEWVDVCKLPEDQ